jgi:hypothetical protein
MCIVMCNNTESGGILCELQCATIHRHWRVLTFIVICNSKQTVEVFVRSNLQQYTECGGFFFS